MFGKAHPFITVFYRLFNDVFGVLPPVVRKRTMLVQVGNEFIF